MKYPRKDLAAQIAEAGERTHALFDAIRALAERDGHQSILELAELGNGYASTCMEAAGQLS